MALVEVVQEHSRFFDHLADLVDPKYFHDDGREHVNLMYMKKNARAATKQAFKEQHKRNKRAKLDPDAAKTTTQVQQQKQRIQGESGDSDEEDEAGPGALSNGPSHAMGKLHISQGPALSREDLLARLHHKLQVQREQRHAGEKAIAGQGAAAAAAAGSKSSAKEWRKQALGRKLKQQEQAGGSAAGHQQGKRKLEEVPAGGGAQEHKRVRQEQQQQQQEPSGPKLTFSKVLVDDDRHPGHKHKKPTKAQLLKEVEEKQIALAAAAGAGGGGGRGAGGGASAESWQSAMMRARGERVLDDPKLLKKSIKKEKGMREKAAKKWQDRLSAQQEQQKARQDKRKENLAARSQTKLNKKKERRDKKLLRAGFEGRKQGFIQPKKK